MHGFRSCCLRIPTVALPRKNRKPRRWRELRTVGDKAGNFALVSSLESNLQERFERRKRRECKRKPWRCGIERDDPPSMNSTHVAVGLHVERGAAYHFAACGAKAKRNNLELSWLRSQSRGRTRRYGCAIVLSIVGGGLRNLAGTGELILGSLRLRS